ncbi:hypothetical protein HNQ96_000936 [Aminobacter lissarensis]|uniref:Uncharacterized protein n=1 Tax=Aminobacter carboxidus TaxID=376165 RepID=A0A8E1WBU1_9HYPH|nr:hypothetical protein [Aminobacter lissarensis]MBB6465089.1 hypothetical protein [Aminobacter lissarensis]
MKTWRILAVSLLAAFGTSAHAEDFIKGVYLQSEELCAQAKKVSLQSVIDAGGLILSQNGIESVEYNCEFLNVTKATRSPAWAVTALCQEPGHLFPDTLSILELNETQIEIVSVRQVDPESGQTDNGGTYVLCDGVAMP